MEKEYLLSWENIVKEGGVIFHLDQCFCLTMILRVPLQE